MAQRKPFSLSRTLSMLTVVATVGLVAIVAVGFWMTREVSGPGMGIGTKETVFADLEERIDAVERIRVEGRDDQITLVKTGPESWTMEEKGGYPVDSTLAERLLSRISGAEALERDEPLRAEMSDRGVADPGDSGEGVRVSLQTGEGESVKEFIVGRQRSAPGATDLTAFYLREAGSDVVWLVDGTIQIPDEPMAWIDETIFALENRRIYEIQTGPDSGDPVYVRRDMPGEEPYVVEGLGEDQELEGLWVLNELAVPYTAMIFTDVRSIPEELPESSGEQGYMRTFDGIEVAVVFHEIAAADEDDEAEIWARFEVNTAEVRVRDDNNDDGDARPELDAVLTEDSITREELEAKVEGWLYKLPDHTMDRLRRSVAELPTRGAIDDPINDDIETPEAELDDPDFDDPDIETGEDFDPEDFEAEGDLDFAD